MGKVSIWQKMKQWFCRNNVQKRGERNPYESWQRPGWFCSALHWKASPSQTRPGAQPAAKGMGPTRGSRSMSTPINFASGTARERERQRLLGRRRHGWKDLDSRDSEKGKSGWREKEEVIIETIMFQTTWTESAATSENHIIISCRII